jgi:glycosyltransferase involved in cell wall biosynthesis
MIITAILQSKNEMRSGHLERFLRWNRILFDNLVVFDDCSDDQSVQVLTDFGATIIQGQFHMFNSELQMKASLLDRCISEFPQTDWILWLDADEILLSTRSEIEKILHEGALKGFDGIEIGLVNLWRSEEFFRVDSSFNDLKNVRFWKNNGRLHFRVRPGLHHPMHPDGMNRVLSLESPRVLHFGFASDNHVLDKFKTYLQSGQRGRNLWRLVDESNLILLELTQIADLLGGRYAEWKQSAEAHPFNPNQLPLIEKCRYNFETSSRNHRPIVTLVSLIYAGVDWLEFQYGELLQLQQEFGFDSVEILFVANDASVEVLKFLDVNFIPYVVAPGRIDNNEWYINSVYRAYNYGAAAAKGEYVLLTNSDMAYFPGFLSQLLKHKSESTYLVGKLIESGRLTPASAAVKRNFGKKLRSFKRRGFYLLAEKLSSETKTSGGLYMPLLIHRDQFLKFGGYPEGNILQESLTHFLATGKYRIAAIGDDLIPGDSAFVQRLIHLGWTFETLNSAIAYHFQEGEKSEYKDSLQIKSGFSQMQNSVSSENMDYSILENHRLHICKTITGIKEKQQTILLTNSLDEVQRLGKSEINYLTAVVTSNIQVLRKVSLELDVHSYFLCEEDFAKSILKDSVSLQQILKEELRRTFLPLKPISLLRRLIRRIPLDFKVRVKSFFTKKSKLFH